MSKPDWNVWADTPWVKVWEAVALSLDVDPGSLERDPLSFMADTGGGPYFLKQSFPGRPVKDEFDKRLRVLIAHYANPHVSGFYKIRLSEYSAWCLASRWPVPPEIEALAKKASPPKAVARSPAIEPDDDAAPAR